MLLLRELVESESPLDVIGFKFITVRTDPNLELLTAVVSPSLAFNTIDAFEDVAGTRVFIEYSEVILERDDE